MNVLITGVNGFIGRYAAGAFLKSGANVTGTGLRTSCRASDFRYIPADLTNRAELERLISGGPYDCIVHLAASLDMRSSETLRVNTVGTYHILQTASQTSCRIFLHLSSVPVIGFPTNTAPVTECVPANPQTPYHVSKYAAEQLVMLPEYRGMKRYNVRVASPTGPGMPGTFLRIMLEAAMEGEPLTLYGSGERVQNYIDARDIAAALVRISQTAPDEGLYLLSGTSCSNMETARLCADITNQGSPIVFVGKPDPSDGERWYINDEKARTSFGYQPQYSLRQSIMDIWEYKKKCGC